MTVSNADQRAAQRYAENISKEPLGYQHAAAAVLPNLLNGSEWAFIKETEENKAEVRGQVVEILKEPRAKIYQVKGGYLVVLDYQSAVNHANAAAPGLFDAKIWAEAAEKRRGAIARLERFLEPLDDGRTRRAMNIALPLFVPSPDGRLPDHNLPPLAPPEQRTRARRRDEKLEEAPFLPSLRVYRYR